MSKKPSIIRRKAITKSPPENSWRLSKLRLENAAEASSLIPDVEDELCRNLVVYDGVACKAPEPPAIVAPMYQEIESLPYDATKTECYPCPYCPNRVFLTGEGLERHGYDAHFERLSDIYSLIERIKKVWTYVSATNSGALKAKSRSGSDESSEEDQEPSTSTEKVKKAGKVDEMCRRCGSILKLHTGPNGYHAHKRGHALNDKLQTALSKKFGEKKVALELTCDHCDMVFLTRKLLESHSLLAHNIRALIWCPGCADSYADKNAFQSHRLDAHRFVSVPHLQVKQAKLSRFAIMAFHVDKDSFSWCQCAHCGFLFRKVERVLDHVMCMHKELTSTLTGQICLQDSEADVAFQEGHLVVYCCNTRMTVSQFNHHTETVHGS